ncbi:nucleoside triphosphate pyrophosphohydrolase [Mycobacterium lentiflavum]|uniref:Nucleoside triphosphate pyrophosphohydrolase n=1 Tax=Mycobacterium lentiflavum TaxID=141349 RepID=A0A0E4CQ71_MYCLN|nr:nucleoside triphosphate pyrophosphohydrolase [Mycobacterium lentiflavum]MEE3066891.1 nucleoside triphosphate pyrophosphohydrolase [Actinomycetota bacterium]ULP41468.1 nucleoside triphosphate pyrophosphohydrolase [Mycobacterium lentiflavum]CQD20000.1 nucleoside triphosphate pyrophosphohydrolase [Mycobacterium lentiflavum]
MIVVLFDPRRPSLVPVEAIEYLTGEIQYTEEMPVAVPWSLSSARPVDTGGPDDPAPVLLSSDPEHPAVIARLAAGARLISAPDTPRGERLVDAVAMMDKLRTAGPWESEQTHDSLRRFLLEETYELLDAVRSGNAEALCEELGDVLLQVLFHARIAEEARQFPFDIDDVATTLMRKLGNRVPGVLAGQTISLEEQLAQWEERKAAEKPRNSVMDDVHTGQPALALAQKVIQRAHAAGLPADLIPADITSISVSTDIDAESVLRTTVLEFVDMVRAVERSIAATRRGDSVPEEFDVAPLGEVTEEEWREHWPSGVADELEPEAADETDEGFEAADEEDDEDDESEDDGDDESEDDDESADDGPQDAETDDESGKGSKKSGKATKRSRDRG